MTDRLDQLIRLTCDLARGARPENPMPLEHILAQASDELANCEIELGLDSRRGGPGGINLEGLWTARAHYEHPDHGVLMMECASVNCYGALWELLSRYMKQGGWEGVGRQSDYGLVATQGEAT